MESFDERKYFSPLLTDRELEEKKVGLTPAEYKKLLSSEKKKGDFNEKIYRFYLSEKKLMRKVIEEKRMVQVNTDAIRRYRILMENYSMESNDYCKCTMEIQKFDRINWDLHNSIQADQERLYQNRDDFDRKAIYVRMDFELTQHKLEEKKKAAATERIEKQDRKKNRVFWKKMNALPYDLIKTIGGYLSYETRIDVLEKTFKLPKLIQSIENEKQIHSTIQTIYHKIKESCNDLNIEQKMKNVFREFSYSYGFVLYKHPLKKLNQALEYSMMLFRNKDCLSEYYAIYRDLVKKQEEFIQ